MFFGVQVAFYEEEPEKNIFICKEAHLWEPKSDTCVDKIGVTIL